MSYVKIWYIPKKKKRNSLFFCQNFSRIWNALLLFGLRPTCTCMSTEIFSINQAPLDMFSFTQSAFGIELESLNARLFCSVIHFNIAPCCIKRLGVVQIHSWKDSMPTYFSVFKWSVILWSTLSWKLESSKPRQCWQSRSCLGMFSGSPLKSLSSSTFNRFGGGSSLLESENSALQPSHILRARHIGHFIILKMIIITM